MNRNPDGRKALGDVMRALRKKDPRDLSQERLGELADIDRTYVGSIEQGRRNPSFEQLWQILHVLGVSWTEFGRALDAEPPLRRPPVTRSSGGQGRRSR